MKHKTRILKPTPKTLKKAMEVIRRGGLAAFPTETVYGLGANALSSKAVKKIFRAKGRPFDNPLIVHVAKIEDIKKIAKDVPEKALRLTRAFWPGPLTLVLKKQKFIPKEVTAGLNTVAVRMPKSKIALQLIRQAGVPIAAPSANRAGRPSAVKARDVLEDFNGKIEIIIDGGKSKIGLESTVLDLTKKTPTILRPGAITREEIEKCLGIKVTDQRISPKVPASPGVKYKHYSPKAKLVLIKDFSKIQLLADRLMKKGRKVAILTTSERKPRYRADYVFSLGSGRNLRIIAGNLFSTLRKCDQKNVDVILAETLPEKGIGKAIMNRLRQAAN